VQAAVDLADRSGVDAVTMRHLGDELGFEAMSLYRYVANKDDLLDGMLDLVLAEWRLPRDVSDWRESVRTSARSVHDALRRHRWAARLLMTGMRPRPARLEYMEWLLRRLRGAGAPSLAADAAQVAAIAFAALTLAAAIAMASGAYAVSSDVEPKPVDPGAVRMSTLGFAIWAIPAALAASAFVVSVSIGALASEALPRWLGLVGLLVAVVMLFGIMFLPSLAVLVWAALVAVVTVVRPESKFVARTTQALA